MNLTHLHLLITHLPIFGAILGAIVMLHGIWMKSYETVIAAYVVFILSGIGAAIAYATGEAAEESVENIAGVLKSNIDAHEDFALVALVSFIILGIVSLIGVIITKLQATFIRTYAVFTLLASLISFVIVARTGYLGGKIRHTELSSYKQDTIDALENKEIAD
jgi:Na+/H+ antiporter NhaC